MAHTVSGQGEDRPACATCKWWDAERVQAVPPAGWCRAHPPSQPRDQWPMTYAYNWCGEHARVPFAAPAPSDDAGKWVLMDKEVG